MDSPRVLWDWAKTLASECNYRVIAGLVRYAQHGIMMIDEQHAAELEQPAPNLGSLDDYEWRILALIGQGRLTRQVAAALAISEETLGDHIEGILEKLGLKSRLDLWMFVVAPHQLENEPELVSSGFETLLRR